GAWQSLLQAGAAIQMPLAWCGASPEPPQSVRSGRTSRPNSQSTRDVGRVVMPSMRSRIAGAVAFAAAITPAAAQDWPVRPVSMVVPFAAGSASDTVARILGGRLSELLGQQVLVENIGGAGGTTGVSRVAKAAPDGYQFVLGGIDTFAQNQTLYKKPLYNSVADFVPVALMVEQPL